MKTLKFKTIKPINLKFKQMEINIPINQTLIFLMDDFGFIYFIFNKNKKLETIELDENLAKKLLLMFMNNKQIKFFYEENDILEIILGIKNE